MALEDLWFESVNRWTGDKQKVITIAHPDRSVATGKFECKALQYSNCYTISFSCFISTGWYLPYTNQKLL